MFKKIITAVLATLMLLIVLPTKVLAEEEAPTRAPISPALNVTLVDYPKDWKVVYQYSDFVPNGTGISVTIHYYFLTTYFDCPIGAGPQYRAYTVGV